MNWQWFISLRFLKSRSHRSLSTPMTFVAICGVAFGIVAALVSLSVMSGFEKAYEEAILNFNSHIVLINSEETNDRDEIQPILNGFSVNEEERVYWKKKGGWWRFFGSMGLFPDAKMEDLETRGVVAHTPFVFREGLGVLPDGVKGVVLKGIDPQTMAQVYPLIYHDIHLNQEESVVRKNSLDEEVEILTKHLSLEEGQLPPVLIGSLLFKELFPQDVPDEPVVQLLVPKSDPQFGENNLKKYSQKFRIIGSFESGLYEFDSQFLLASLSTMDKIFDLNGAISGYEIVLDDRFKASKVARAVEERLPFSYQAISWDELNESLFMAMKMERTLFFIIMLLVLLIASFNVMGIILMLILKRQSDLLILKAMGARPKALHRSFALLGLVVGFLGVALGSFLSVAVLWSLDQFKWILLDPKIYFISTLPVNWSPTLWVVMVLASLIICYSISQIASRLILRYGRLAQTFK